MNLNSGRPYNVTTGFDDNQDGDVNDRPTYSAVCNSLAATGRTISGLSCSNPSNAFVTRNAFNGPYTWNTNFQLSRSFSLRRGERANNPEGFPNGGFPGGGGDFGGNRGGGGGNRGGGGGGGSFGGGGGRWRQSWRRTQRQCRRHHKRRFSSMFKTR